MFRVSVVFERFQGLVHKGTEKDVVDGDENKKGRRRGKEVGTGGSVSTKR